MPRGQNVHVEPDGVSVALGGYAVSLEDVEALFDGYLKWAVVSSDKSDPPFYLVLLFEAAQRLGWQAELIETYESGARSIYFRRVA